MPGLIWSSGRTCGLSSAATAPAAATSRIAASSSQQPKVRAWVSNLRRAKYIKIHHTLREPPESIVRLGVAQQLVNCSSACGKALGIGCGDKRPAYCPQIFSGEVSKG